MSEQEQLKAQEQHDKIRTILIDNNAPEFGDSIIDEICQAVGIPDTCDIADEHGNLHPQSFYKN